MLGECGMLVTARSCDRDWLADSIFPGVAERRDPASFLMSSQWPFRWSKVVAHPALSWRSRVVPSMGSAQLHRRRISPADNKKAGLRLSIYRGILGAHCSGGCG